MITIANIDQPTDIVMLTMQFTHCEPWNLEESLMIYDDECVVNVQIKGTDTDIRAECCGFIAIITLEQFQDMIDKNPNGVESDEPINLEFFDNINNHELFVLLNFMGKIEGTSGSYIDKSAHDWRTPYIIELPTDTVIEPYDLTKKRLGSLSLLDKVPEFEPPPDEYKYGALPTDQK
jgi:hypothetical protein